MSWYRIYLEEIEDGQLSPELLASIRIRHRDFDTSSYICYFDDGFVCTELSVRNPLTDEELAEYGVFMINP